MPNGKGSKDWGWVPSFEELMVASFVFFLALLASKNIFISLFVGALAGGLVLWANNGWPGPWDNFGR